MKPFLKIIAGIFLALVLISNALFTWVDRSNYQDADHYKQTISSLDRHFEYQEVAPSDSLKIGWSTKTLIPNQPIETIPLAGYGARNPKEASAINDSVAVRSLVISNRHQKVAMVSVELLIVHPEVAKRVYQLLEPKGWRPDELYLGATHSHSSLGAWAPGVVGKLFAGDYDAQMVEWLSNQIAQSVLEAGLLQSKGSYSYGELSLDDLVRNRLVGKKGITDPSAKVLLFQSVNGKALDFTFGAHATCLGHKNRLASGDYPAIFSKSLTSQGNFDFVSFRAGAVASMSYAQNGKSGWDAAQWMGEELAQQAMLFEQLNLQPISTANIYSYRLPVFLPDPQLKITNNLCLRPWLFNALVGSYPVYAQVHVLNDVLMISLPCDFSGELAVPLYEYARKKGVQLIINSFNGGYIGYVPKDQWYDLNKYETRTMAWYGPQSGAYFTEIIERIIDQHELL
ncbi:MAG: neutral ceramidase [Cyclobacteriaceae bacterium]|jgi:neutral ceramidase